MKKENTGMSIKLFCGFCAHKDTYRERKFVSEDKLSKGKQNVSNVIYCRKCGRQLNHKNKC